MYLFLCRALGLLSLLLSQLLRLFKRPYSMRTSEIYLRMNWIKSGRTALSIVPPLPPCKPTAIIRRRCSTHSAAVAITVLFLRLFLYVWRGPHFTSNKTISIFLRIALQCRWDAGLGISGKRFVLLVPVINIEPIPDRISRHQFISYLFWVCLSIDRIARFPSESTIGNFPSSNYC